MSAAGLYLPLFSPPLPDLALDTAASLLCYPRQAPAPSPFSSSLPISLSCRGWILGADRLPSLLSPWPRSLAPPHRCSTSFLLSLCFFFTNPPASLIFTIAIFAVVHKSSSMVVICHFVPPRRPVDVLGIRKGVQILRPSSFADYRRLLDLLLRLCHRSLTVLPSCLRPPPLLPLPVIVTVNLPKFLCHVVLPSRWPATTGGISTLRPDGAS